VTSTVTDACTDESVADRFLDERAREVRDQLRRLLADRVAPYVSHHDVTGEFAGQRCQAIAEAGLGGLLFPAELGGTDDSAVTYAMAVAEIAAVCPATSLIYMTQMHAAYPILLMGSPDQQRTWIPRLCSAESFGSLAITEPDRRGRRITDSSFLLFFNAHNDVIRFTIPKDFGEMWTTEIDTAVPIAVDQRVCRAGEGVPVAGRSVRVLRRV